MTSSLITFIVDGLRLLCWKSSKEYSYRGEAPATSPLLISDDAKSKISIAFAYSVVGLELAPAVVAIGAIGAIVGGGGGGDSNPNPNESPPPLLLLLLLPPLPLLL